MQARHSEDARSLVDAIESADLEHGLFRAGETVVVGVSGGPDSVALLTALAAFAPRKDLRLHAAHLDHSLRRASAEDAAFVSEFTRRIGVPVTIGVRDVGELAASRRLSIEDAARRARYAFLFAVSADNGATVVAVGHQAHDQAETVLMNFIRGSGIDGLKGMTPVSAYPLEEAEIEELLGAPEAGAARVPRLPRLVRPLLDTGRSAIEAFLRERGIESVPDPSNLDRSALRNRLRHSVIPLLEEINPRLTAALARNARLIAHDLDYVELRTSKAWDECVHTVAGVHRLDTARWRGLHPAIQRRLLRRSVADMGLLREFGSRHIEALRLSVVLGGSPSGLPENVGVTLGDGWFALERDQVGPPTETLSAVPLSAVVPGWTRLPGGWTIRIGVRARRTEDPLPDLGPWHAVLDAAVFGSGVSVRGRRPGDRMQPLGLAGRHKKLQDLFVDGRVPSRERNCWPLVMAGDEIAWVPGLSVSHEARLTESTVHVMSFVAEPPARLR